MSPFWILACNRFGPSMWPLLRDLGGYGSEALEAQSGCQGGGREIEEGEAHRKKATIGFIGNKCGANLAWCLGGETASSRRPRRHQTQPQSWILIVNFQTSHTCCTSHHFCLSSSFLMLVYSLRRLIHRPTSSLYASVQTSDNNA